MSQQLTTTQVELLQILPTTLDEQEMDQLQNLLKTFSTKVKKEQPAVEMVAEPITNYTVAESEPITLTIPRTWLDDAWMAKLLNWVEMKRLTERNQMTEAQALEMGKQAKANWWADNQQWVLAKIDKQI